MKTHTDPHKSLVPWGRRGESTEEGQWWLEKGGIERLVELRTTTKAGDKEKTKTRTKTSERIKEIENSNLTPLNAEQHSTNKTACTSMNILM